MKKLTSFFWFCSGADPEILKRCPTESTKYVGIGATVFFTGLFAAIAASYSLYTVFDSVWAAIGFGLVWGVMIFNLDRYIVSSMRKEGKSTRELLVATPRIVLAILISIVIAKPLELKIFDKEIQPELAVMERQKYAVQETLIQDEYTYTRDSIARQIVRLKSEVAALAQKRDELVRIAQEEADGTGGSRKRNLGPIYKVKKADADKAQAELERVTTENSTLINSLQLRLDNDEATMNSRIAGIERRKIDGPAARIEALDRLTEQSTAIFLAHWFIILLFIALETAPVFVKLISPKGPYDSLLHIAEHQFFADEIESLARTNAEAKARMANLPQHERTFGNDRLDAALK